MNLHRPVRPEGLGDRSMMMAAQGTLLQVVLLATFATFAVRCASNDDYPFRNTSLPWDDRVTDLVRRLTVDEVIEQLAKGTIVDRVIID